MYTYDEKAQINNLWHFIRGEDFEIIPHEHESGHNDLGYI